MRGKRSWTAALLLLLAGCVGGERAALAGEPEPAIEMDPEGWYGTAIPAPQPTPTIRLVGADNSAFDLAAERGKIVLLFLGYTQCPDVCPATLSQWKRVKAALGADTTRVRFVFVSVDPERDTPDDAAQYARRFDPAFVGLTGRRTEIDAIQRQFGATSFAEIARPRAGGRDSVHSGHHAHGGADSAATPASGAGAYLVAHLSRIFVIDRAGRWRLLVPADAGVKATVRNVERLLKERPR